MALTTSSLRIAAPADDEEIPTFGDAQVQRVAAADEREKRATDAVFLALKALSHRALVALASLVDLALIASAFALWVMVIREPTQLQLISVGMYAVFVLLALYMRHRRA